MIKVTYVRVVELPDGARMQYEFSGEELTISVIADGGSEVMVRTAEAMWTEILNEHMQPRTRLRLVAGGARPGADTA